MLVDPFILLEVSMPPKPLIVSAETPGVSYCPYFGGLELSEFATEKVKVAYDKSTEPKCKCCSVCQYRYTCDAIHSDEKGRCFNRMMHWIMTQTCEERRTNHEMVRKQLMEGYGVRFCSKCKDYFVLPYCPSE